MNALVSVTLEDHPPAGQVARVSMRFHGVLHLINSPAMDAFVHAFENLASIENLRAVVLRGATNRAFIGGADIKEMAALDPASARRFITRLHDMNAAIRACPVPVIAQISGYCLGGGLEVAAACDLRAASEDAVFGMPEVLVGIPSVIEAVLLPRLVGWGKARELVYTGRSLAAAEALQCGLVERVAPNAELDRVVGEWIAGILRAGPNAIRLQKQLIRQWEHLTLEASIQAGIDAFARAYETNEPKSSMQAFLNRYRPPAHWKPDA